MKLNDMQKKVVYSNERFLFLLAGAGSGKTRVVIERIKYLLNEGVDENEILALTFTNKAANEMKHRIGRDDMNIHTFHQFCYKELKTKTEYTYQIFIEEEHQFSKRDCLEVSLYKNSLFKKKKPKIYDFYQNYLERHHLKDFDDLLIDYLNWIQIKKHKTYTYLFVDEFQDTNELQYNILKALIDEHTHVLCVGDPDQSIYQFRGANPSIINKYVKDYQAVVEKLTINYRSNSTIISHANRLIKRNYRTYKKDLTPYHTHTNHVTSYIFMNPEEESNFIISYIKKMISQGIKPDEIAVLYRQHHRCYKLIETLKTIDFTYYQEKSSTQHKSNIHLLSIHQAKGLEFDVVIILGLESNIFPSAHTYQNVLLEEERRLMFVAITRAKEHLICTHIKYNDYFQRQKPSLFIKESGLKNKLYKPI